jgi:hypothetical protein
MVARPCQNTAPPGVNNLNNMNTAKAAAIAASSIAPWSCQQHASKELFAANSPLSADAAGSEVPEHAQHEECAALIYKNGDALCP